MSTRNDKRMPLGHRVGVGERNGVVVRGDERPHDLDALANGQAATSSIMASGRNASRPAALGWTRSTNSCGPQLDVVVARAIRLVCARINKMSPRFDVSQVPLQGGYVAKQCPVRAQNDMLAPEEPLPPDLFTRRLFANGNAFEAEIVAEVLRLHPRAIVIDAESSGALEAATRTAMSEGSSPILSARLPSDLAGRRVGRPDLLIAAPRGGYWPVDVKWHQNLEPASGRSSALPGLCSSLDVPDRDAAILDDEYAARKRQEDLLQLAHYQRMLESIGMQATDGRWAGIIGTEQRVVWYDLDAPIWKTPSSTRHTKVRSTMDRYDFEFAFRLDVLAVAQQQKRDPSVDLLTVPVKISECGSCPWWDYCRPQLEEPPGDVSLLPRIGWSQWKIHRDHGVTNRAELAELDPRTARLVAGGIDVTALMAAAPNAQLADLVTGKALALLASEDIGTPDDLQALCARTASYSDVGLSVLPTHIDLARAALGPAPVYRRRGVCEVISPRADVEIDVDMESTELGCYMWGSYVSDRSNTGIAKNGYRAFVTWDPLTPDVEAQNSLRFWRWLMEIRQQCHDAGIRFAAYCYNAGAENTYLRRLGIAEENVADEIERFIGSDDWVDLLRAWDSQLITGGSSSLKTTAPLAGFQWGVDDAGGGESMIKHDLATRGDKVAQDWLLGYNRGDVEATVAVRQWMASTEFPGIEDVPPAGNRGFIAQY
jgi:predicted RecB family nuclease